MVLDDPPLAGAAPFAGEVIVVFVEELVWVQGCQTKSAMRAAITMTAMIPNIAAELPLSRTTTFRSSISEFLSAYATGPLYPLPASANVPDREAPPIVIWSVIGLAFTGTIGLFALYRSYAVSKNFYAYSVYGMTPAVHRRYAYAGFALAFIFLMSLFWPAIPVTAVLTLATVGAILYGASYVRGATGEDE